jgi:NAD(P)-dependent dehydrogenase (short-subunit alcohol dehydrogenase family)
MASNADILENKSVVITGATSGIGLATAVTFAINGAFVIGIGRSESRISAAKAIIQKVNPRHEVIFLQADLAQQKQVQDLGVNIINALGEHQFDYLDVLINNAGIYLEKKEMTIDGIEKTFAVNHLAPFLLTHLLLPYLERAQQGRVLTVSSYSHRTTPLNLRRIANPWPYIGLVAYKRSKLCNVLFSYEFNRCNNKVEAFAVDPGLVNTEIALKGDPGISEWVWRKRRHKGTSADVPVKTLLFLSSNAHIDTSNGYFFRDSQAIEPSRNAKRLDLAKALWTLSMKLTGI